MSNTVLVNGQPRVFEAKCGGVITPGDLVEIDSAGEWVRHNSAGETALRVFALERDEMGSEVTVNYASGDQAKLGAFRSGEVVDAICASGETINIGSLLDSNGDGTLKVVDTSASTADVARGAVVGVALEGPGALAADTRVNVILR